MVCYVSKWVRVVYLLSVLFVVMCVGVFLSSFCVLCSMVCYVSKWIRGVHILKFVVMCVGVFYRSVSCPQWCVMLVSGSVLFIFLSLL